MIGPLPDPRDHEIRRRPTWRNILVSYAMVAAIPLLLFVVSQPLVGSAGLATSIGLAVGARRARKLRRCFYDCQAFAFDVGGRARITVTRVPANDAN